MRAFYLVLHSLRRMANKQTPFIIAVILTCQGYTQTRRPAADTKSHTTLKAFDFRGKGYDASKDYALKNGGSSMPVIVEVQARKGDTLIKITGKVVKALDAEGYKNMVLLASDADTTKATLERVLIYSNRSIYGILSKGFSDDGVVLWIYYNRDRKKILQEYPKNFNAALYIKQKICEAYRYSGHSPTRH